MVDLTIQNWDTGLPGADWDSGLQWDVNVGPNLGSVAPYLALVVSQHNQRPKFMTMLENMLQPLANNIELLQRINALFDLDTATAQQLDVVGQWVGVGRNVAVPLTGVYFALDTAGVGFNSGSWYSFFNPLSGLVVLGDDGYRSLIRARIVNNLWDGTVPGAYRAWDTLFAGTGIGILIQDLGNMHMIMALTGPVPDAVTLSLFKNGYLDLRPAGVQVDAYLTPSIADTPYFGFDVANTSISGFDTGAWGS